MKRNVRGSKTGAAASRGGAPALVPPPSSSLAEPPLDASMLAQIAALAIKSITEKKQVVSSGAASKKKQVATSPTMNTKNSGGNGSSSSCSPEGAKKAGAAGGGGVAMGAAVGGGGAAVEGKSGGDDGGVVMAVRKARDLSEAEAVKIIQRAWRNYLVRSPKIKDLVDGANKDFSGICIGEMGEWGVASVDFMLGFLKEAKLSRAVGNLLERIGWYARVEELSQKNQAKKGGSGGVCGDKEALLVLGDMSSSYILPFSPQEEKYRGDGGGADVAKKVNEKNISGVDHRQYLLAAMLALARNHEGEGDDNTSNHERVSMILLQEYLNPFPYKMEDDQCLSEEGKKHWMALETELFGLAKDAAKLFYGLCQGGGGGGGNTRKYCLAMVSSLQTSSSPSSSSPSSFLLKRSLAFVQALERFRTVYNAWLCNAKSIIGAFLTEQSASCEMSARYYSVSLGYRGKLNLVFEVHFFYLSSLFVFALVFIFIYF